MPEPALLVLEGLPPTFTSDDLQQLCEPYGTVVFATVMLGTAEQLEEQVGLVAMETVAQGAQLVEHLHQRHLGTHTLKVTLLPTDRS